MKITVKLVLTIIIVSLFSMLLFEFMYNKILYKSYIELYDSLQYQEKRIDELYKFIFKNCLQI